MSQAKEELGQWHPQALAQRSVECYLCEHTIFSTPSELPDYLRVQAGCFVSIRNRDGELRGCIGTILPALAQVADEIIYNAIKAASEDFRFQPVNRGELANLSYSVDILSPLEEIPDLVGHDAKIHGLMIEAAGGRRGVLLPDLPGIDTAEMQLAALRNKIGLWPDVPVRLSRFTVRRFGQK